VNSWEGLHGCSPAGFIIVHILGAKRGIPKDTLESCMARVRLMLRSASSSRAAATHTGRARTEEADRWPQATARSESVSLSYTTGPRPFLRTLRHSQARHALLRLALRTTRKDAFSTGALCRSMVLCGGEYQDAVRCITAQHARNGNPPKLRLAL
jgi:hypothetical protein